MLCWIKLCLVANLVPGFTTISPGYTNNNKFKRSLPDNYQLPNGGITEPSLCESQREKAKQDGSDWVPNCRDNGYYSLRQCNKANECWCSDLLGTKMSDQKPASEVDCQKPCFLRKTTSLFTFDKCDKNGEFQQSSTDIPDFFGGF